MKVRCDKQGHKPSESSNEDDYRSVPPIPFVSFVEKSLPLNKMSMASMASSENIDLENGSNDSPKSEWRMNAPIIDKSSHNSENYNTSETASPSEYSELDESAAPYKKENNLQEEFLQSDIIQHKTEQIQTFQNKSSPPHEHVDESTNTNPEHHYESFHTILYGKENVRLDGNHSQHSNQQGSTPPHSNKNLFLRSNTDISALTNQIDNIGDSNTHFQSFILALAFLSVWLPQNLMAPNLTQMAETFNFDASQRDALLGANIAFATGVLSLPVSGCIGFLADVVKSRRNLYALTTFVGGLASLCCGLSKTYTQLYFARFVSGGCMAGCTPISFSLLGDLFETKERNMASSALTAMMGIGIIMGQVVAGMIGPWLGWRLPFYIASGICLVASIAVMLLVEEPVRGGKEEALQEMLKQGISYDRKLTLRGFIDAMIHNRSNFILMLQGFFCSVPWGIIFVFLNDYLSQEQGLSVQDATFLVFIFGIGCASGGLLGGACGQYTSSIKISYMPIFMGFTTLLGILPFLGLLNVTFHNAGPMPMLYAFAGGSIANLPSVNVRPCLINVNTPELRGAALTANNSVINLARGIGPSFLTWICSIYNVDRQFSFNVLLTSFWIVSAIQLFWLADTLPNDKLKMEKELREYAKSNDSKHKNNEVFDNRMIGYDTDDKSDIVSIEERMTSFDCKAIKGSLKFMSDALKEMTRGVQRQNPFDPNESWENLERANPTTKESSGGETHLAKSEKSILWKENEKLERKKKDAFYSFDPSETDHLLV